MWLGNTGIWTFWWIGCRSFDLLSGFMEGYVIMKFCFEEFFLGFLGYGKLCCKQDDHHRNLHILSHFHNLDPHDLAVRILHIFVLFCRIFCYGHTFGNWSTVGDWVYTLSCSEWESQPLFIWGFPGHLLSKYINLPVSTFNLYASSFFPLL